MEHKSQVLRMRSETRLSRHTLMKFPNSKNKEKSLNASIVGEKKKTKTYRETGLSLASDFSRAKDKEGKGDKALSKKALNLELNCKPTHHSSGGKNIYISDFSDIQRFCSHPSTFSEKHKGN